MQNIPYWRISEWDVLFLMENTKNMKQITEEQIDSIITETFLNANETSMQDFVDNYHLYKEALKDDIECLTNNNGYAEFFYFDMAVLKTVQDNCVSILKETLKELLCEPSDDRIKDKKGESNVQ